MKIVNIVIFTKPDAYIHLSNQKLQTHLFSVFEKVIPKILIFLDSCLRLLLASS